MRVLPAVLVLGLVVGLGPACGANKQETGAKPTATSSTVPRNCPPLPAPTGKTLPWFPADLPVPSGSYVLDDLSLANLPYKSGDFVVPRTVDGFIHYVVAEWPKRGWKLRKGDAEPGEAELPFGRGTLKGTLRIRAAFCDRSHSLLVVSLGDTAPPLGQGTTSTSLPLTHP